MKTTIPKLRKMIRRVISEHGPMHGGHPGRGSDMPLPPKPDTSIVHWHDFKEAVEAGDYDEALAFLVEIGCDDEMDQEAFLGDGLELSAEELANEWSYISSQM